MKKVYCLIAALSIILYLNINVYADTNITRAEFAQLVYPLLCDYNYEAEAIYKDVDTAEVCASAVSLMHDYSLMTGKDGFFNPNGTITNEEAAVILVKAFEIRCGAYLALGKDTFINDWFNIDEKNKVYIAKAATIGAMKYNSSMQFLPKNNLTTSVAVELVNNVKVSIDNLVKKAGINIAASTVSNYRQVNQIGESNTIDLFLTYNDMSNFSPDNILVILCLKENGIVTTINVKEYKNAIQNNFNVFHNSIEIPNVNSDYQLQAYVWNGISMSPIMEKMILNY